MPWIRLGANCLPIVPGDKKPAVDGWGDPKRNPRATPILGAALHSEDSPKIPWDIYFGWVAAFRDMNALVFPATLGATVVDVDDISRLDEVLTVCGPTPYRTTSGRVGGGVHLWYRGVSKSKNAITTGVDVKSTGGYVIAPGSIHPKTGMPYIASLELAAALAAGSLSLPALRGGWREALEKLGTGLRSPTKTDLSALCDVLQTKVAMRTWAKALRAVCRGESFAPAGERDGVLFRVLGVLAREWPNASVESIVELFRASAEVMEAEADVVIPILVAVEQKWMRLTAQADEDAEEVAEAGEDEDGRPAVDLGGDDRDVLRAIASALVGLGSGAPLFRQGGALVTVDGAANDVRVAVELGECLRFTREGKPASVPRDIAQKLAAKPPGLPRLVGRRSAPVLRGDGSLVYGLGYDAVTGVWCDGWDGPVVEAWGKEDAEAALGRLMAFAHGGAWESDADYLAWFAHVLTVAGRTAVAGPVPAFVYTAPRSGSGKTALARSAGLLGGRCGAWTSPDLKEDRELGMRLDEYALCPAVVLDNMRGVLRSELLEGAVTGGELKVRRLYVGPVTVPWSAVLSVTSNGAEIGHDWVRRALPVRLNATPPPPGRDIVIEAEERKDLTRDALTVLAGWLRSGERYDGQVLLGFVEWSRIVAGAIRWAFGGVDVVAATREASADMVASDDDGGSLLDTIERWAAGKEFTARELWDSPRMTELRSEFGSFRAFTSRLGRLSDATRVLRKRKSNSDRVWRIEVLSK